VQQPAGTSDVRCFRSCGLTDKGGGGDGSSFRSPETRTCAKVQTGTVRKEGTEILGFDCGAVGS